MTTNYEYYNNGLLKRLKDSTTSATLFDRQYTYNTANQISQLAELTQTRNFTYDNVDRLTGATNGTTTESYTFDDVGNRTASHLSASYGYQSGKFNQLSSTATASFQFDANGNTIQKSEGKDFWRYTWDYENRLTEASTRKEKVRYKYDALGRRVERNLNSGKDRTKYTLDGVDVLVDNDDGTLTKYLNGPGIDNKLREQTGSTVSYFLADHLGSTNGLTDATGNVTSSASYDSFGNKTGNLATRYQFTGREFDSFTNEYFYRARFYNSNLGRFSSEDPIGFEGGDVNWYGYVTNDPLALTDPLGLDPTKQFEYPKRGKLPGTNIWYRMDMRQEPYPNMHVFWNDGSESVISHNGGWQRTHGGRPTAIPPKTYRTSLRSVVCEFVDRVRTMRGMGAMINVVGVASGALEDYDRWQRARDAGRTYDEQMCEDYGDAGPFLVTPLGVFRNPYLGCKGA